MDKTTGLPDLRSFTYEELETFLTGIGEKRFRAGQVFAWLSKGVQDFDEMTNLSKQLREKLSAVSTLSRAHIEEKYISKIDGTVKYLIGLGDGECVETRLSCATTTASRSVFRRRWAVRWGAAFVPRP